MSFRPKIGELRERACAYQTLDTRVMQDARPRRRSS